MRRFTAFLLALMLLTSYGLAEIADGTYAPDAFEWSGGSGRLSMDCTGVTVKDGNAVATIVLSSKKIAYVKIGDTEYDPIITEQGSQVELPVMLNVPNEIAALTTAMSQPHEVAYTVTVYLAGVDTPAVSVPGHAFVDTETTESGLLTVNRYEDEVYLVDVKDFGKLLILPEGVGKVSVPGAAGVQKPLHGLCAVEGLPVDADLVLSTSQPDYAALVLSGCEVVVVPADCPKELRDRLDTLCMIVFTDRSREETDEDARAAWQAVYALLRG